MNENVLQHYGVLGMKWGVRRTPAQLARARKSSKKSEPKPEPHEDYKKAHSKKSVREMSDAELKSRLNRLDMEQRYSKLSPTKVSTGKRMASNILKVGTTVAAATTTALTIYNNADKIRKIVGK